MYSCTRWQPVSGPWVPPHGLMLFQQAEHLCCFCCALKQQAVKNDPFQMLSLEYYSILALVVYIFLYVGFLNVFCKP